MFRYHLRILAVVARWWRQGKPRGAVSRLRLRASRADCDWLGHINNARYLELFDAGRTDLFLRLGLFEQARREKWHMVVGTMNVRYRKEVRAGARFEIESRYESIQGKALLIRQRIWLGDTLATDAEAHVLIVRDRKAADPAFLLPLLEDQGEPLAA